LSESFNQQTTDDRERKTYYLRMTLLRQIGTPAIRGISRLFSVLESEGAEHLPRRGPVILAANHITNMDVLFLQFCLPRPIFFMGKEELFQNPVLDWVFRQLGAFPVRRGARDAWAFEHARRVLENGQVLGMFPEGTRNRGRGLGPARPGAARLAQMMNCPIVPVGLYGTQEMFHHFPRRARIQVKVGEPIVSEMHETVLNLTDRIMFALAELLPAEARGVYRYRPPGF
jgi:1-acyl-sn-glycerol-3-phosphate acyltransferase